MIHRLLVFTLSARQVRLLGNALLAMACCLLPTAWVWEAWGQWGRPLRPELVAVPGGTFTMGSPEDEPGRSDDEVQHAVTVSPFWISRTEVSQGMYRAVMGELPACVGDERIVGDDLPVHCVSWADAVAFCARLSELEGLEEGEGYRLPTEAEWEYAARAGTSMVWAGTSVEDELCAFANVPGCEGRPATLMSVGALQPNAWGLYDMSGNVWEWTSDWDGAYEGDAVDPRGPPSGSYRVYRGGSWRGVPALARVAHRSWDHPSRRGNFLGFRLARSSPSALSPSDPLPAPKPE
jgi:sulfatase modifying factor 1